MNDNKQAPTFKEKVIKEGLTFGSKTCAVGDEIEVTAPQRERLRKKEFIADTATARAATKD